MPEEDQIDHIEGAKRVTYTGPERSEMLDRTHWASDFGWRQVQTLAKYMRTYEAAKGAVLLQEGARSSYMCLIVAGTVSVVKGDAAQGIKYLAALGPGKTFGEMALIDTEPRSASVVTKEETLLLVLTERDFEEMAEDAPKLAIKLLKKLARMLSERLRKTSGTLSEHLERIDR